MGQFWVENKICINKSQNQNLFLLIVMKIYILFIECFIYENKEANEALH